MNVSKALVVDDSKVVRVMFKRMLEARGLGVDTAASGQEALDYLKGNVPDLVFMDYMMTGADGYEVTAMIAADPKTSSIPVIMCTANDTVKDRERADGCGAIGFLTKPIGDGALDSLLKELRDGVAAPRALAGTPAAAVATAVPTEDILRAAERAAQEAAEKYVREAMGALSASSDQASRSIARDVAAHAAQEALASWRMEAAKINEQAETAAMAAAERVAQTILQQAADDVESSRRSAETVVDAKLKEALASAASTAERVARQTLDAAKSEIEDATRKVLDSARAELHEGARQAAEAAARPAAETAMRAMADEGSRHTLAATGESEAALHSQWEQRAEQASEYMAQALTRHSSEAAASLEATKTEVDAKLREALAAVSTTAERVARETVDAARATLKDESREDVAARPDFDESVRAAAEVAAKPVAEAAAKAVAEAAAKSVAESTARAVAQEMASASLVAASENEAALRNRLEQGAIASAVDAARSFVEQADVEADAARASAEQRVDEKLRLALAAVESTASATMLKILESARADIGDASRQVLDSARAELLENVRVAAEAAAKPIAEAAAREVIEQVARETLAAAMQEEAAARTRVEQSAIAVAERVGRELVQLAFSATAKHATAPAANDGSPEAGAEARTDAPAPQPAVFLASAAGSKARSAVVPWLAALTLAVVYLLFRTFG